MRLKSIWEVVRDTGSRFSEDRVTTLGAALAYYAIFSIYNSMDQVVHLPGFVARVVQLVGSLVVLTFLFGLIFKMLADVRIRWRDLWVGAVTTALLFLAGEYLLGLYLSHQATGSPYGAAGSVVLILVWIYYSSLILLAGAEFTNVYARHTGSSIEPAKYAEWIQGPGFAGQGG